MSKCATCGQEIEPNATNCVGCKRPLSKEERATATAQASAQTGEEKVYFCYAIDEKGNKYAGELKAKDKEDARNKLKTEGYKVESLYEKNSKEDPVVKKKVQQKEAALFYLAIGAVIGIGIAIYFLVQ